MGDFVDFLPVGWNLKSNAGFRLKIIVLAFFFFSFFFLSHFARNDPKDANQNVQMNVIYFNIQTFVCASISWIRMTTRIRNKIVTLNDTSDGKKLFIEIKIKLKCRKQVSDQLKM